MLPYTPYLADIYMSDENEEENGSISPLTSYRDNVYTSGEDTDGEADPNLLDTSTDNEIGLDDDWGDGDRSSMTRMMMTGLRNKWKPVILWTMILIQVCVRRRLSPRMNQ